MECKFSEKFFPMNTDASNVEDINFPKIIERLSMSCIASSDEGSNIFGTRSFTLFKNDRDFRERFDSVTVSESISLSMTNLSSTGLPVLAPDISPNFLSWEEPLVVNVPFWVVWWAGAHHRPPCSWLLLIPRAHRYCLTFRFGFHRAFQCSWSKNVRIPHAVSRDQIHHRLWFCCDSFFTCIFLCSFRHRFKTIDGTEMADVEQTQKMIPLITCEISLCQCACELVLGVDVFVLFLGSKLILSNNQSRATRWVRETCLIVGLLPFVIILITASVVFKEIQ